MPGVVKRKYDHESFLISKNISQSLKKIAEILPQNYSRQDLVNAYIKYYPFEWQKLVERQQNYKQKDIFLISNKKNRRYNPKSEYGFFFSVPKVKHLLSEGMKSKHSINFDEESVSIKRNDFEHKRMIANEKTTSRIAEAKINSQNVTPTYLKYYIKAYHKKRNNH